MTDNSVPTTWHILGAGAIGSLWAYYWREAGFPVTLITKTPSVRNHIRLHQGATVTSVSVTAIGIDELLASSTTITHLLISTKAQHTLDAVKVIRPRIAADATILILQNGMAGQQLPALLPTQKLITGITSDGVYRENVDTIVHAGKGITYIDGDTNLLRYLPAQALDIRPCADILAKQWRKLGVNCAINGLTAIHFCRNGELLGNSDAMQSIKKICREVTDVATAVGQGDAMYNIEQEVIKTLTDTAENYSSLYQDIAHGRQTEIDYINGYIIEVGETNGICCEENRAIVAAVKSLEPH